MYVQVGIHPLYFQFYDENCDDPIHAGYTSPNLAGVLTGYDLSEKGKEYWELYIRRHDGLSNRVELSCEFDKDGKATIPFAGIASKIYRIEKESEIVPVSRLVISQENPTQKILSTQDLESLVAEEKRNMEIIVLDTKLFDCEHTIDQIDVTNVFSSMTSLTLVGPDDVDYSCFNFFSSSTLKEFIDLTESETNCASYEQSTGSVPTEVKEIIIEGTNLVSVKFGDNKYNSTRYSRIIKGNYRLIVHHYR